MQSCSGCADIQKLRAQVVTEIRSNQQLENDLSLMDIKIGLLVRNRITLQVRNIQRGKQNRELNAVVMAGVNRTVM